MNSRTTSARWPKTAKQVVVGRMGFYAAGILLATAIGLIQLILYYHGPSWVDPQIEGALSPLLEKQLDAFWDMNRLLITLGTTLLGTTGFLLNSSHARKRCSWDFWSAMGSALAVSLSLYFGYQSYVVILGMMENGHLDLHNPEVLWVRHAHFYTFLLGVFFFADFVFHELRRENGRETNRVDA